MPNIHFLKHTGSMKTKLLRHLNLRIIASHFFVKPKPGWEYLIRHHLMVSFLPTKTVDDFADLILIREKVFMETITVVRVPYWIELISFISVIAHIHMELLRRRTMEKKFKVILVNLNMPSHCTISDGNRFYLYPIYTKFLFSERYLIYNEQRQNFT